MALQIQRQALLLMDAVQAKVTFTLQALSLITVQHIQAK